MQAQSTKPTTIDEYIARFSIDVQLMLQQLRELIIKLAPEAEEIISYSMPAFKWNGRLVWFAGYKNHIGFYPGASTIAAFQNELANYKWAKGSVQFSLHHALPVTLIAKIVKFKMKENVQKVQMKEAVKKVKKPSL